MMKAKWSKGLTKKELKHLAEGSATGRPSLRSLRANLTKQHADGFRCFECDHIAFKLNLSIREGE